MLNMDSLPNVVLLLLVFLSYESMYTKRRRIVSRGEDNDSNLVDPASSHMLVSKIKPCMSKYKLLYGETANGSLKQL